ncbi:MAG: hypothetical protein S4CHLAM102_08400 [Chlamydiia bacterium]|nr:hypothetical protein [Chlamydiia bacterium]
MISSTTVLRPNRFDWFEDDLVGAVFVQVEISDRFKLLGVSKRFYRLCLVDVKMRCIEFYTRAARLMVVEVGMLEVDTTFTQTLNKAKRWEKSLCMRLFSRPGLLEEGRLNELCPFQNRRADGIEAMHAKMVEFKEALQPFTIQKHLSRVRDENVVAFNRSLAWLCFNGAALWACQKILASESLYLFHISIDQLHVRLGPSLADFETDDSYRLLEGLLETLVEYQKDGGFYHKVGFPMGAKRFVAKILLELMGEDGHEGLIQLAIELDAIFFPFPESMGVKEVVKTYQLKEEFVHCLNVPMEVILRLYEVGQIELADKAMVKLLGQHKGAFYTPFAQMQAPLCQVLDEVGRSHLKSDLMGLFPD